MTCTIEDRIAVREELLKKMTDLILKHKKELQSPCFLTINPKHPIMQITGEMFCDMDEMLNEIDRYRQKEAWQ